MLIKLGGHEIDTDAKYINLSRTKISDLSPLKHVKFTKLQNLHLNNNQIRDLSPLKDIKFHKLDLSQITIEFFFKGIFQEYSFEKTIQLSEINLVIL